jgi:hypothetical protein
MAIHSREFALSVSYMPCYAPEYSYLKKKISWELFMQRRDTYLSTDHPKRSKYASTTSTTSSIPPQVSKSYFS